MPKGCLTKTCLNCEWSVIVSGKLDCNYLNRLGIGKPTIKAFSSKETEEEVAERQLKDAQERLKKAKDAMEGLKKLKKEAGVSGK